MWNPFQKDFNGSDMMPDQNYSIYNQGIMGGSGIPDYNFNGQVGYNQGCFGSQNMMNANGSYTAEGLTNIFNQSGIRVPPPTSSNIQAYIANQLQVPLNLLKFTVLDEPLSNSGIIRHACKFSLLELSKLEIQQLQYFDKASIEYAYCPNCFSIRYYVEKYSY